MAVSKDQIIHDIDKYRLEAEQKVNEVYNLAENNQLIDAIGKFQEALTIYKKNSISTPTDLQKLLTCYSYLIGCCTGNNDQKESIKLFHEIISFLQKTDLAGIATVRQLNILIGEFYERLYDLYLDQEEEFEALTCAIGAALIYEKINNIPPINLLKVYNAIIVEYRIFERYEDLIHYCEKALRIYYTIENPADETREIATKIIAVIGNTISNDEVPHNLKIKLFHLGLSYPKLCDDFYRQSRFDWVILLCQSNITSLSSMPLALHRTLYIAKFHILAGMALSRSKQYLLAISEFYKAITLLLSLPCNEINTDQHISHLLETARNQLYKTYTIVTADKVLYYNQLLEKIYRFCASWFINPPDDSTSISPCDNITEQDFIYKLQCINDSLKKAVVVRNKNCSEAVSALNQLFTFILDPKNIKLFFRNSLCNILRSPLIIENIKQLLGESNKILADTTHSVLLTMTLPQYSHPVFSARTVPSTPLDESNDEITTKQITPIAIQTNSQ